MRSAVELLLTPGTCLKKVGSVRTYRVVESVDGPYVHVRKPNGQRDRLNVEGLFDTWEVGIDSHLEAGAFVRDTVSDAGETLALASDMLAFMRATSRGDEETATRLNEFSDRLEALMRGGTFAHTH